MAHRLSTGETGYQAGSMLTMEELAMRNDMAEHNVMQSVVKRNMARNNGCKMLPFTTIYFGVFCICAWLREDIVNVNLLEVPLRGIISDMLKNVDNVAGVQRIMNPNSKVMNVYSRFFNLESIQWKYSYNSIEGPVLLEQTRYNDKPFGKKTNWSVYNTSAASQELNDCFTAHPKSSFGKARQLHMATPSIQVHTEKKSNVVYRCWMYPSVESSEKTKERLLWLQDRQWIDEHTQYLEMRMYLSNLELGRPLLEEVVVQIHVGRTGGVLWHMTLNTIFLCMHENVWMMLMDGFLVLTLASYTLWEFSGAVMAFMHSDLIDHLLTLQNLWEWFIIAMGWYIVISALILEDGVGSVIETLKQIRVGGQNINRIRLISEDFFTKAQSNGSEFANVRVAIAQYVLVLTFRFFVSFGAQPRLAQVTRTLSAVVTDLLHFMVVFMPAFLSFVVAANLLFGRRMEEFATLQSSLGVCLRMALESEYDWDSLSAEEYWMTALWVWGFMMMVTLLMLNIVLAIILDVYNEVRDGLNSSETVWSTMWQYVVRLFLAKTWVNEQNIEKALAELTDPVIKKTELIQKILPTMSNRQAQLLFDQCKSDAKWAAGRHINRRNFLKVSSSIVNSIQTSRESLQKLTKQDLESWTTVTTSKEDELGDTARGLRFLTERMEMKAGSLPQFKCPMQMQKDHENARVGGAVSNEESVATTLSVPSTVAPEISIRSEGTKNTKDADKAPKPPWLREVHDMLMHRRAWMQQVIKQLDEMQGAVHLAHMSKIGELGQDDAPLVL